MKKLLLVLLMWFSVLGIAFAAAPVDINTANQEQLDSVKGIGPAKAKAIIEYRTKNGPFKSVDDLEKVKGFGKKSVDNLRSQVTVGGAKSASAPAEPKTEAKGDEKAKPKAGVKEAEKTKPKADAKGQEKDKGKGKDKAKPDDQKGAK